MNYITRRALMMQEVPINLRARTRAVLAACAVQPSRFEVVTFNRLVAELEDRSIINYLDRFYCVLLHDEQASRIDLVNPGTDTLVKVNSPDFYQYQGWKGDGISKHLTSTWTPTVSTHFQQNAAFMSCWSMINNSAATIDVTIGGSANIIAALRPRNNTAMLARTNTSTGDTFAVADGSGMFAFLRDGAASTWLLNNKAISTQKTRASEGRPTGALNLLRQTGGSTYSQGLICCVAAGAIPNTTMYAAFCDLVTTYLINIGAWEIPIDDDPPPSGANYFTSATVHPDFPELTLGSLKVMRATRPPTSNAETSATYTGFPLTDIANNLSFGSSTWTGTKWWFGWHMRAMGGWNARANLIAPKITHPQGLDCRCEFTTKEKANAAFRVQLLYILGASQATYEAVAVAAGYTPATDIISWATLNASPATYFTLEPSLSGSPYKVIRDKIWLPPARLVDQVGPIGGVVVDWEVQDNRTPQEAYEELAALAEIIHDAGYLMAIWTNPYNATSQAYNGLNSRDYLWQLHEVVDIMYVELWSKSIEGSVQASWEAQIDMFRGPDPNNDPKPIDYSKIGINFELGISPGTSDSDAETVRALLLEHPEIEYLYYWPNFATLGGAGTRATNRKQSMTAFGVFPA